MKKNVELDEEELEIINRLREEKAQSKHKNTEDLEARFAATLAGYMVEIERHIQNAKQELDEAVKLSELHGIPFSSRIVNVEKEYMSRKYMPHSFKEKWGDLPDEVLEDNDIWYPRQSGWEYWNTSSLTC